MGGHPAAFREPAASARRASRRPRRDCVDRKARQPGGVRRGLDDVSVSQSRFAARGGQMGEDDLQLTHTHAAQRLAVSTPASYLPLVARRAALVSALVVTCGAVIAVVVASPLAMAQLGSLRGVNWAQLSEVGQTYGAASALLTGLALLGVVGSMVYQARTIKVSREQSYRDRHGRLVEMALDDPIYQRCWGSNPAAHPTRDHYRQQVYLNLIVSNWEQNYVLGGFREHALRGSLAWMFRGEAGRTFWAEARKVRLEMSESRRSRRFCRIVEEEYQKAVSSGPPIVQSEDTASVSPSGPPLWPCGVVPKAGVMVLLGAVSGIALKTFLDRAR